MGLDFYHHLSLGLDLIHNFECIDNESLTLSNVDRELGSHDILVGSGFVVEEYDLGSCKDLVDFVND